MGKDSARPERPDTYRRHTLRPLNSLLFIAPMLLLFHAGYAVYGTSLLAPAHLHELLKRLGASASVMPAALVIAVLLVQHLARKDPWQLHPKVLAGMFGESMIWMVPLIAMIRLSGRLLANQALSGPTVQEAFQRVMLAVGAGIYEEFIFRLTLISLIVLIFVNVLGLKKEPLVVVAVIIGAAVFSLYHISAQQLTSPVAFPWAQFTFRTMAGIYLGMVFVFRGFGIAVGTHAFYNIYAFVVSS